MQGAILRIQFVAQPIIQSKIWPKLPTVLSKESCEGPNLHIFGITKALLESFVFLTLLPTFGGSLGAKLLDRD